MSLRGRATLITSLIILFAVFLFSVFNFHTEKSALLEGVDAKLTTAARMAKEILPSDYHNRIENIESVSTEEYLQIVDTWNGICRELELEYIWSLLLADEGIFFTSGSSTSKDVTAGDHAFFYDKHSNPEAYRKVFQTMEPDYLDIVDEWGHLRAVLLPFYDEAGRKYLFGASMKTEAVGVIIRDTLVKSLLISLCISALGIFLIQILARSVTRPITRLIELAGAAAAGKPVQFQEQNVSGITELNSLHESIRTMYMEIQGQMEALHESRENLRITLHSIGDAVIATDMQSCITQMNQVAQDLTGWTFKDAREKPLEDIFYIINAKTRKRVENPVTRVLESNGIVGLANHTVLISKTKKEYQIADSAAPIRDDLGRIIGVVLVFRDVTKEYRMRETLRRSEEKLRHFVQSFQGIAYQAEIGSYTPYLYEGTVEEITGYSAEDFLQGKINWRDIIHPADKEKMNGRQQKLMTVAGYKALGEYRIIMNDGKTRWIRDLGMVSRIEEKELVQGTVIDISEQKLAEEKLLASLDEKEILLREIHHRVKNNMQLIIALLNMQSEKCDDQMNHVIQDITGRIRIFSDIHNSLYQYENISMINFSDHLYRNFENLIAVFGGNPENFKLSLQISSPLFDLNTAVPCGLMLNELMMNSFKHGFIDSGIITIAFDRNSAGDITKIVYTDNGRGFQQNEEGFGTVVIRSIAGQLGLDYQVINRAPPEFSFLRKSVSPGLEKRAGKILFVEDEIIIAMARISELKKAGFSVDENIVISGEDAVHYFERQPVKPSLIVMDIRLRGELDGFQTARRLKDQNPELPIIFISGYEEREVTDKISGFSNSCFLKKTCTSGELIQAIERAGLKTMPGN